MKSHKINKFFERYVAFLLKWRWAAIALFVIVLLVSFYGMFTRYAHNSEVWIKLKYCF